MAKKNPKRSPPKHTSAPQVEKTINDLINDGLQGKIARQVRYKDEIGAEICIRIANGESLNKICRDEHMPYKGSVHRWLVFADDENIHKSEKLREKLCIFRDHYNNARILQAENFLDVIPEIATDGSEDYECKVTMRGGEYVTVNKEHINRSRLSVETFQWITEIYLPKVKALRQKTLTLDQKQPINLHFDKQDENA